MHIKIICTSAHLVPIGTGLIQVPTDSVIVPFFGSPRPKHIRKAVKEWAKANAKTPLFWTLY